MRLGTRVIKFISKMNILYDNIKDNTKDTGKDNMSDIEKECCEICDRKAITLTECCNMYLCYKHEEESVIEYKCNTAKCEKCELCDDCENNLLLGNKSPGPKKILCLF